MQIEIGAPACLPLALVKLEGGTLARLGVTLRHPPINLAARAGAQLDVTGARADYVADSVRHYLGRHGLPETGELEIELAIPSQMGLGSLPMMALAGAQAAAWVHGQTFTDAPALAAAVGLGPENGLEVHAFAQGGVLLVEAPPPGSPPARVLRRQTLAHPDPAAWAFVVYQPRLPAGLSPTLEADRLTAQLAAGVHLSTDSARVVADDLWPALVNDDLNAFGQALRALQALNEAAMRAAGAAVGLSDAERVILEIFAANGAAAWGRSPTGLALYALVRGASPSVAVRKKVVEHVGLTGGTVMASVVDNTGARHQVQPKAPIYTGASPLVSGNR